MRDLGLAEREHGDIPVGVPAPGTHEMALGGVFEHHDALGRVVVNGQIKAAVKNDHGAVGAVQLSDCGTALDMPRVPGNRHHVVDGDVLGEEIEKVAGPGQPIQALFDDPEERIERGEVLQVGNGCLHDATSTSGARYFAARSGLCWL